MFERWTDTRNVIIDVKTVNAEDLVNVLRKCYAEVRKRIVFGILRVPLLVNVSRLIENRIFLPNVKMYSALGNPKPQNKPRISDMSKLKDYFHKYNELPTHLQEVLWFTLC